MAELKHDGLSRVLQIDIAADVVRNPELVARTGERNGNIVVFELASDLGVEFSELNFHVLLPGFSRSDSEFFPGDCPVDDFGDLDDARANFVDGREVLVERELNRVASRNRQRITDQKQLTDRVRIRRVSLRRRGNTGFEVRVFVGRFLVLADYGIGESHAAEVFAERD